MSPNQVFTVIATWYITWDWGLPGLFHRNCRPRRTRKSSSSLNSKWTAVLSVSVTQPSHLGLLTKVFCCPSCWRTERIQCSLTNCWKRQAVNISKSKEKKLLNATKILCAWNENLMAVFYAWPQKQHHDSNQHSLVLQAAAFLVHSVVLERTMGCENNGIRLLRTKEIDLRGRGAWRILRICVLLTPFFDVSMRTLSLWLQAANIRKHGHQFPIPRKTRDSSVIATPITRLRIPGNLFCQVLMFCDLYLNWAISPLFVDN